MTFPDTFLLIAGVPLIAIVPLLVELAKQHGLPVQSTGIAAIGFATALLAIAGIALGEPVSIATVARWLIGGIVYGLAAAGLYSQRQMLTGTPNDA